VGGFSKGKLVLLVSKFHYPASSQSPKFTTPQVRYLVGALLDRFIVRQVRYLVSPLFDRFTVRKVHYQLGSLSARFIISQVSYLVGALPNRFTVRQVSYLEGKFRAAWSLFKEKLWALWAFTKRNLGPFGSLQREIKGHVEPF
jgi:hypothetical protein